MNIKPLSIPDVLLIEPKVFKDERGYFIEKYKKSEYEKYFPEFVQDNFSVSKKGVLRGLHYQLSPFAQGKLVSVLKGKILDVFIDMRKSSEFFGKWGSIELSDENNFEIYVPEGFAHGFLALSDEVLFYYKCTKEYSPQSERGVRWNDESLAIDWNIQDPIMYERDRNLPLFKDAEYFK